MLAWSTWSVYIVWHMLLMMLCIAVLYTVLFAARSVHCRVKSTALYTILAWSTVQFFTLLYSPVHRFNMFYSTIQYTVVVCVETV